MSELPTQCTARVLAALNATQPGAAQDVAECLGTIADLVAQTSDPSAVLDRVRLVLAREDLEQVAADHHVTLHETRAPAAEQLADTVVIWTARGGGLAVIPYGQHPADTLAQVRAALAERAEERRLTAEFQAAVAAGASE